MNNYRKTAIIVGILFIIATVANVVGNLAFLKPILDAPNYLTNASANGNRLIMGGILKLIAAFAIASIVIWLYPILRKYNESLALGAVGFRLLESALYVLAVIVPLSILTLSQEYVKAGTLDSFIQASGSSLLAMREWAGQLAVISFAVGGLMYYSIFYRSKLIPRWLSGWGLVGAVLSLASALLSMFGLIVPLSPVSLLSNLPIGVQEMVLAVWLIVKGFNSSVTASLSKQTEIEEG